MIEDNLPATNRLFLALVLISLPALYFSRAMPFWIPPLAAGQLLFIFLVRYAVTGQLLGQPALVWLSGALFLLALASLTVTGSLAATLPQTYAFIANLAIFGAVALQRDERWLRRSGWGLLAAGFGLGLLLSFGTYSIWYSLPAVGRISVRILPTEWLQVQLLPGYNPNMSGGVLALFWVPTLVLAWRGESWLQRDLAKVTAVILTVPIFLAEPRGAWVGLGLALVTVTLLQSRRWLYLWLALAALLVVGIYWAGPAALIRMAVSPYDTFGLHSMQQRWALWQQAATIVAGHPLAGVGLGLVEAQKLVGPKITHHHAHNLYLQIAAETGLAGLALHLVFFGTLFYLLLRRARRRRPDYRQPLALGLLGSLIVFLTHGLVDVITYYAWWVAPLLWTLFGLMAAVSTAAADSNQIPPEI